MDLPTTMMVWADPKASWGLNREDSHHKSERLCRMIYSNFLTCAVHHGLTLYVSSKLQAMSCNTGPLAADSCLLIHAMQSHTAEECQLNPDLIEMLLIHGNDPLVRWDVDRKVFSAWSLLLYHEAAMDPPDSRRERWKKIATMFVKHLHSLEQLSKVENLLEGAESISTLSVSFVRQQLKEKAEQLVTIESPIPSRSRRPLEQLIRGSKRQKKK